MVLDGIQMHFGPQNHVFCVSPPGLFSDPNRDHFLDTFFKVLGVFRGLLGAVLGFPRLFWEASGPQKVWFYYWKTTLFDNAAFGVFEALDGLLGLVLPSSWADLVPKWSPKWTPKVVQETPQKYLKNRFQRNLTF